MKLIWLVSVCCSAVVGCHQHEGDHNAHHHDEESAAAEHGHSHGADAKSFSGATHKEGKGITLLPETKERLNLELSEVTEQKLPWKIGFTVRVFAAEPNGWFEASGLLATDPAHHLKTGSIVRLQHPSGTALDGRLFRKTIPVSTNETEVIVRFASTNAAIAPGAFLRAEISVAADEAVTTIPKDALIKGATESFVYVQNEDAYLRTLVTPGRETEEAVEIKDGLLEGDLVVSRAAMDLWLVELRAVKGGQGCCPAPPVKGKGK